MFVAVVVDRDGETAAHEYRSGHFTLEPAGATPVTPDECPESHMDDGSHATDYEDSGRCAWCGEANPDWAGRGTAEGP